MRPILIRLLVVCLCLSGMALDARAALTSETPFTSRGETDFDTALQLLNPYGAWAKIGGKWAYTPTNHLAPYTDGRWLYTEYGWYWKGRAPHSWATEHYGYWKRTDGVWSWYPGPYWLPQIVEIRATNKYLGWRCAEVDDDGNFVEEPIDRFSKTEEWTFVTLAQFANPITPATAAPVDIARAQLEESTDCRHTYLTYRVIDRPGPHPADFADLSKDGGMLAPVTLQDEAAAQATAKPEAPNPYAAKMTGTNQPSLVGQQVNPGADARKVRYWITMSLPSYWTSPPPDAKVGEVYIYRPDFYQDMDGIKRRISLWFNPNERTSLKDVFAHAAPSAAPSVAGGPTNKPATPAEPARPSRDPFRSPLDEPEAATPSPAPATNASSKGFVPSGKKDENSK